MTKTQKKYVFITFSEDEKENISPETMETIFKSYARLANLKKKGLATPFVDILEIPEDLFNFLINQVTVSAGILEVAKNLLTFEELNAKVLCIPYPKLKDHITRYEGTLNGLLEKMTQHLGEVTTQLVILDKFKELFLSDKSYK